MHFAHSPHATGNKSTKLALVVVFHVIIGIGLVKTMNVRLPALPVTPPPIDLVPTDVVTPSVPPPTALPVTRLPPPAIAVPLPDVPATPPPLPNQVTTTTAASDPVARVAPHGTTATGPATPDIGTGSAVPARVRAAALVDGCVKPAYPAQAARNGDSGTVTLALLVGVDGKVSASRIERSSGFPQLDKAALNALSRCAFNPAMQGDVPQAGWAQVAYTWTLE